jgi:hypothetical protein
MAGCCRRERAKSRHQGAFSRVRLLRPKLLSGGRRSVSLSASVTERWTCPVSVEGFLSSYLRFSSSILLVPCSLTPQGGRSFHRHDYRPPR